MNKHEAAWVAVLMDRLRVPIGLLVVLASVASWGLLMWAVRQTLMLAYQYPYFIEAMASK